MNNIPYIGRFIQQLAAFLLIFGCALTARAMTYQASLEQSSWDVEQSRLECKLAQEIPAFGEGVFAKKAGEPQAFYLKPWQPGVPPGQAILSAQPPSWKPGASSQQLASLEVTDDHIPVLVEDNYAVLMLESLGNGLIPTIEMLSPADMSHAQRMKVAVSSVNFQEAYRKYSLCLAQLLPVTFQQIARSTIFFNTNKTGLADEVREKLDLIASYVKADRRIKRIFIDGHTDDTGSKKINRNVSKKRANTVAGYFKKLGVNSKMLTTRFHAGKYPVLKNDSDHNRSRNRRVTIRLERD